MTDHDNNQYDPSLMDTQSLLRGVQLPENGSYDLDEILAEFRSEEEPELLNDPVPVLEESFEPEPPPPPEPPSARKRFSWPSRQASAQEHPEPEPTPEPKPVPKETRPPIKKDKDGVELTEEELLDLAFWRGEEVRDFASDVQKPKIAVPQPPVQERVPQKEQPKVSSQKPPKKKPLPKKSSKKKPSPEEVSVEDMVASTVDAVKDEQEKYQERIRKQLEKLRRPARKKAAAARQPLPELEREPPAAEMASRHKQHLRQCRRNLFPSVLMLILLWLPWVAVQSGKVVPFFSESGDNAALCVLICQAIICILCWPVYRMAVRSLSEGNWTIYTTTLLATVVTLLDEMTMLLLPGRTDAPPLGGIAACLSVFALWGLTSWHKGMAETFRIAAMGTPTRVADHTPHGAAKGRGNSQSFFTRVSMEDTSSQWQRLLLPVLAVASGVFAGLASIGQERPQDFLWCWSAVLCAASSPVFLLAYNVPFGRAAAHLARDGAAVAGMYGASALSGDLRLVVTDTDLFPKGSAGLASIKLYGEEKKRAVAYAGSLASQGGGLLGRMFEDACRTELVIPQTPEHFHIHEDGGLSGMLHGETVLLGTPSFMRRHGVRLPHSIPANKLWICLAVDGILLAAFGVRYTAAEPVEYALRILHRAGFRLTLATRDPNLTPKLLRTKFGTDCGAQLLELGDRLAMSVSDWSPEGPNGLLYREGILPYAYLVTGSRRLCQTVRIGNIIAIFGSIAGALLAFYLTFVNSYTALTPLLVLTFVLLWVIPMLPLVWTADKA